MNVIGWTWWLFIVIWQDLLSSWCIFQDMRIDQLMIRGRGPSRRDWEYPMVIEEAILFLAGGSILWSLRQERLMNALNLFIPSNFTVLVRIFPPSSSFEYGKFWKENYCVCGILFLTIPVVPSRFGFTLLEFRRSTKWKCSNQGKHSVKIFVF